MEPCTGYQQPPPLLPAPPLSVFVRSKETRTGLPVPRALDAAVGSQYLDDRRCAAGEAGGDINGDGICPKRPSEHFAMPDDADRPDPKRHGWKLGSVAAAQHPAESVAAVASMPLPLPSLPAATAVVVTVASMLLPLLLLPAATAVSATGVA